jgi:hypothetical protein
MHIECRTEGYEPVEEMGVKSIRWSDLRMPLDGMDRKKYAIIGTRVFDFRIVLN